MTLKEKFAEKMLTEKLDFLPFNESYELFKSDEKVTSKLYWIYNGEELEKNLDNWNTLDEVIEDMREVFWKEEFVIWTWYNDFQEFTVKVCPAPTYIDLIK